MAFFDFDFIENFFFISLGITFALIILLVYHFKQRISSMERKGDTMYELITNVVKELQFMKKLNAYYETLFQNTASPENDNSPKDNVLPSTSFESSNSCLAEGGSNNNIVMNLTDETLSGLSVENPSSSDKPSPVIHQTPTPLRSTGVLSASPSIQPVAELIVVSDDESSVSDNESDSDDTDLNYSTDDEEIDDEEDDIARTPELRSSVGVRGITGEDLSSKVIEDKDAELPSKDNANDTDEIVHQSPVEMNHLMEMIQKAFASGISPQEPQKFAPYYHAELEQPNSYKPVVIHDETQLMDEPMVDVLDVVESIIGEQFTNNDSYMQELDINELDDFSQHPEDNILEREPLENSVIVIENVIENEPIVVENTSSYDDKPSPVEQIQTPVLLIDKKQTREVYRKMNITQLRGIAIAAGITVDTTKMKKNELIQLLENLEE